ncbi:uncharacterized protein VDAG_01348 [Verticillium dahliae VdLs.17]|uniref:CASTOR ACT domain-containing protein n=1 Tax=Verticillium dahliae (strain VdLs.17 / ATCC MYA-4575 / FGSC 10137) TaxID=498257 RepID=G2WU75_VERDV|nr:uncharacterized protein VDAG_01348 [Verticillium dahliae VdLs.17]EGY17666.1 hypothetical protein VDAG_01348 [Verticillium dahliae VdLs.17]
MVAPNVLITILALLPQSQTISPDDARETPPWPQHSLPGLTEDHQHNFLNVSVTPLEASVVCHADWARTVFRPAIDRILETLPSHVRKPAVLSPDTYLVLSVISGGGGGSDTDIVARILDLTAPLALAGIPIFFISTYYSDFILVPAKDRATVLAALTARGFQCPADHGNRFVASRPGGSGSGLAASSTATPESPASADAATLATLFDRTFAQLKTRNVVPSVDPTLRLVQLSARETPLPNRGSPTSFSRPGLGSRRDGGLVFFEARPPRTLTLAVDDPPSLLLDRALVPLFGDTLVGSADEELVALSLDLAGLPLEATGIVCGVAGRLVQDPVIAGHGLSYLSTAFAGTVVLAPEQARRAVEILEPLLR